MKINLAMDIPTSLLRRLGCGFQRTLLKLASATLIATTAVGCTSLTQPINGIPSNRLPPQFFAEERNNLVPIDFSLLAQEPPRNHLLDRGDVLGIYIEGIFPYRPLNVENPLPPEMPPVNFPTEKSTLPPSTGFPIPVMEDGTIALPLLPKPIEVRGRTIDQARDLIRKAIAEAGINPTVAVSPVVTLIKEREYNVVVIRQDNTTQYNPYLNQNIGRGVYAGDQSAAGNVVKLPYKRNDIMNALMETGGLPGLNAKNEIKLLRASKADQAARAAFYQQYAQMVNAFNDPCGCPPPPPEDPTILRIPLRLPVGVQPAIRPEDAILEDGDIIVVEARDNEFFYTGGLLPPGQWPLPRDYDLDALGAMAIAGGGIASQGANGGGLAGLTRGIGGVPPGRLYILRRTPCKGQLAIEVDLATAINNPASRPIIQPGDTLILQYKPCEEALNFGLGTFFTYGIQQLLSNR